MSETRKSIWREVSGPTYPPLTEKIKADAVVVGGGITGLTSAILLREAGLSVALVEADRICSGTTGYTTGKLTALHRLIYADIAKTFDEKTAALFAEANSRAIDQVETLVGKYEIDCDFRRLPAYTYTTRTDLVDTLEKEARIAGKIGLPVELVGETELPFPVEAAIKLDNQARFHPGRYLNGLAEKFTANGGRIFEQSRVIGTTSEGVRTDRGEIEAKHVIIATLLPILDRGLLFIKNYPWRSYLLAVSLQDKGSLPAGMYISAEDPVRSLSPAGEDILLIGGESHHIGHDPDPQNRYQVLENWARNHFTVKKIEFSWSSQDFLPADGLPYIGYLHPFTKRIMVATGFGKWGLTRGTFAAMTFRDMILGKENHWRKAFTPYRLSCLKAPGNFIHSNMHVGRHFIIDRLKAYTGQTSLPNPGEAAITKRDGRPTAIYRKSEEERQAISPVCTHLGCYVSWNKAEKSWDCPCHGSRFTPEGEILCGPAVKVQAKLDASTGKKQKKDSR